VDIGLNLHEPAVSLALPKFFLVKLVAEFVKIKIELRLPR